LESVRLPAIAAIASVTAISAASATTTMAAAAAATATATTAVSTATAATAAATAGTFCLRPCFVHHEVAPAEILTIQRIYRAICIVIAIHFDESETARLSRKTITDEIHARGCYTDLREPLVELIFRSGKRKIPDIELLHLPTPSARNPI
jgi:hypothetical protein